MFTMVIFGFIILTFVFWGTFSGEAPGSGGVLTTVNGESVSYSEFQTNLNRQLEAYGQLLGGGQRGNEQLIAFITKRVASELVTRKVMAQKAQRLGMKVGKEDIVAELERFEAFHDPQLKRFSPRVYKLVLDANNLTPRGFENTLQEEVAARRLSSILDLSLIQSSKEEEDFRRVQGFTMDLATAALSVDALKRVRKIQFSEEDLGSFFESRRGSYLTDEKREIQLAQLNTLRLRERIEVSDAEIEAYFEAQVAGSSEPRWSEVRARAQHILISEKTPAGRARASRTFRDLEAEKSKLTPDEFRQFFQEQARLHSEDYASAYRGGDLGYFNETEMVAPFSKAVFESNRRPPFLVGPIESDFGLHLIYVVDRSTDRKTLENRRAEIRQSILAERTSTEVARIREAAFQAVNGKKTDPKILEDLGFSISTSEPVDRMARNGVIPIMILQKAFGTAPQVWDGPESFEDNLYFYRALRTLPPEPLEFVAARDRVERDFAEEKALQIIRELETHLASGELAWSELRSFGAQLRSHRSLKAFTVDEVPGFGQSESLLRAMQSLDASSPVSSPIFHENQWVFLRGENFEFEDVKETSEVEELASIKRSQTIESYVEQLVERARIPKRFRAEYLSQNSLF